MKLKPITLLFLIFSTTLFGESCEPYLKKFYQVCQIQMNYRKTHNSIGEGLEYFPFYRSIRLLDEKTFQNEKYTPWNAYKPAPLTWVKWEMANHQLREIVEKEYLINGKPNGKRIELIKLLKELHRISTLKEAMPLGARIGRYFQSIDEKNLKLPEPGNLRDEKFRNLYYIFNDPTPQEEDLLKNYDLKFSDGSGPMITTEKFMGRLRIVYPDGSKVLPEMIQLENDFNRHIKNILNGNSDISPFDLMADMQRRFVSIHPFYDGDGRTSRFLQDILSIYFDLPFIPGGLLQNDLTLKTNEYRRVTLEKMDNIMDMLKNLKKDEEKSLSIYSSKALVKLDPSVTASYQKFIKIFKEACIKEFKKPCYQFKMIEYFDQSDKSEAFLSKLKSNHSVFHWASDGLKDRLHKLISNNSFLYNKFLLGKGTNKDQVAGFGIYASRSVLDSSLYRDKTNPGLFIANVYKDSPIISAENFSQEDIIRSLDSRMIDYIVFFYDNYMVLKCKTKCFDIKFATKDNLSPQDFIHMNLSLILPQGRVDTEVFKFLERLMEKHTESLISNSFDPKKYQETVYSLLEGDQNYKTEFLTAITMVRDSVKMSQEEFNEIYGKDLNEVRYHGKFLYIILQRSGQDLYKKYGVILSPIINQEDLINYTKQLKELKTLKGY